MTGELYKRYRPTKLSELVGQDKAVKVLEKLFDSARMPHAILIHGPSGCGKTTICRIMKKRLKVHDVDFQEINAAQQKGIEFVRELQNRIGLAPAGGKFRMFYFDEIHQLTAPAQDALLKLFEDTPKHVYFVCATTDPAKLKKTLRNRCTDIGLVSIPIKELEALVNRVCEAEGIKLSDDVRDALVEAADGSARKCLVLLNAVADQEDESSQLDSIKAADTERQTSELARLLLKGSKNDYKKAMVIVRGLMAVDEPESVRRGLIGYCNAILTKGVYSQPAYNVINVFRDNVYDSGWAGITAGVWEVLGC